MWLQRMMFEKKLLLFGDVSPSVVATILFVGVHFMDT